MVYGDSMGFIRIYDGILFGNLTKLFKMAHS